MRELGPLSGQVLEALDDAAVVTDSEGTILWASARVSTLWGYAPAEIQRKKLQFLIAWESRDLLAEAGSAERRDAGRTRAVEAYRKDGTTFPVALTQIQLPGEGERRHLVLLRDLSDMREARGRLRQLDKALATAQVGVAITDRNLAVRYANPAFAAMHGLPLEQVSGESLARFLPVELAGLDFRELVNLRRLQREGTVRRSGGGDFPVEISFDVVQDEQGDALGVVALCQDISERRRTEKALRESEERYSLAVRGANDGLWDWDLEQGTVHFSPRWQAMLGLEPGTLGTRPEEWFERVHEEDRPQLHERLERHLAGGSELFEHEHRMLHEDGNYRWMLARGAALFDASGKAHRIAGSQTDITDRKVHDPLTGLPNRALYLDRLERARARARRSGRPLYAVLFLDLDRFKVVNDSLGHAIGDQLLVAVAERVAGCLRTGDTVARLGGDEFAVLLEEIDDLDEATEVAERFHAALARPFKIDERELFVTLSIGLALGNSETTDLPGLLRDADTAMYRAKTSGRGLTKIFTGEMRSEVQAQLQLETDLRRAVEREEFVVYYQPILALEGRAITGFEALVRWNHPERGLVEPAGFIPAAEETGVILPLGMWVLEEACRQIRVWRDLAPPWAGLTVSVNLSPKLFAQGDLVAQIAAALERTRLPPTALKLEITEGVLVHDPRAASVMLKELRRMGVGVCIDDFGTGYSSLSYLTSFSVDVLKIDRSFIANLAATGDGNELVRNIVRLATGLGLAVVAEGVETDLQREQLESMHCEFVQGFHFSRPVAPALIEERFLRPG